MSICILRILLEKCGLHEYLLKTFKGIFTCNLVSYQLFCPKKFKEKIFVDNYNLRI